MHDGRRFPSEGPESQHLAWAWALQCPLLRLIRFGSVSLRVTRRGPAHTMTGSRMNLIIVKGVSRNFYCIERTAKSNCHIFMLSYLAWQKQNLPLIPAVVRSYCIFCIKDFTILAFVFGHCRWSANLGVFWSFIAE